MSPLREPIVDDIFTRWEKLETQDMVQVTEENIGKLAKLFGWSVDYSVGEEPVLRPPARSGYMDQEYGVGTWLTNQGRSAHNPEFDGWHPAGTWVKTD